MGKPKEKVQNTQKGQKTLYIGVAGAFMECVCGKIVKKGMVVENQRKLYCSEDCF